MRRGFGSGLGPEIFVDTSAWFALAVPADAEHARLAAALRERVAQGVKVVTGSLVVAETHALLVRRVSREAAIQFTETVGRAPNEVVPCSPDLEAEAMSDWLKPFADEDFSLADAVSFAVMKRREITEALTLDLHFATAGFVVV